MGVLKHKLWFDLWKNKGRTLQIVLIIAMGAAAMGIIIGIRELVIPNMEAGWQSMNPAMINIGIVPSMEGDDVLALEDDDLVALRKIEGVLESEAFNATTIEWRLSAEDEWSSATLTAREAYPNQRLNKLELISGHWPTDNIFATEQGASLNFAIPETDGQVFIRVNDKEHLIQIDGTLYNQLAPPAYFGGTAIFYTTITRFRDLTELEGYNQFLATAAEYDEAAVTALADLIQNKIEKQGKESFGTGVGRVMDPNKHFFQDFLDGLFFLLGVMGGVALILGLLLVYNTVNAIISQQTNQIGIMKAVGAQTPQILGLYLTVVLSYSLMALFIALPVGIIGSWAIASWLITSFNADPGNFTLSSLAITSMILICLLAPALASFIPVLLGARITVREAISSYGLQAGSGMIERILARTQRISRLILITFSNTFQRKWRVVLTQITLVLSGLIFMMVISVRDSVIYTFDDVLFSILNYDINFVLEAPQRMSHLETLTLAHPEVTAAEMWGFAGASFRLQGQDQSDDDETAFMLGVPLPTQLYGYQVRAGRWLEPSDTHAVVLNQDLAKDAGVDVGDWITFQLDDRKSADWQVVGLLFDPIFTTSAHVPRETLLLELGEVGKASTVWIQSSYTDVENQADLAKRLRSYYKDNQVDVSPQRGVFGISDTAIETGTTIVNQFNFIVVLLAMMAVIIGAVGSIALSGALALSVLERRREIGVMRAIGASSWAIARLFIGEGLILGWLSWLIALPFSVLAGQLMLQGMAVAFELDLVYKYTPLGAILWLGIITVLSVLASLLPSRGAMRVSVQESLAYQ